MIINRVADVLFILGIILIFLTFKTTDFILIFDMAHFILDEKIYFLGIYLNKINLISFFY
jgi:NADH:ubiquinone oxidoreductase subunit 5 (subunit L)/multisubunit Na+/H+ antiporter MnhA subunit